MLRRARRNTNSQTAEIQSVDRAPKTCAFEQSYYIWKSDPQVALGVDGKLHSLYPVTSKLPKDFPQSCEGSVEVDPEQMYRLTSTAELCVKVCVTCPKEDCPSVGGHYRENLDGSFVIINVVADELRNNPSILGQAVSKLI